MNKCIKLVACVFISVLTVAVIVPTTAQAGTLTIYNKNCTKTINFKKYNRVTVHVYQKDHTDEGCTNTHVTVNKKSSKTIELVPYYYKNGQWQDPRNCKYKHEAHGTVAGKEDVHGNENASVTCKKDRIGVCQCTKD